MACQTARSRNLVLIWLEIPVLYPSYTVIIHSYIAHRYNLHTCLYSSITRHIDRTSLYWGDHASESSSFLRSSSICSGVRRSMANFCFWGDSDLNERNLWINSFSYIFWIFDALPMLHRLGELLEGAGEGERQPAGILERNQCKFENLLKEPLIWIIQ